MRLVRYFLLGLFLGAALLVSAGVAVVPAHAPNYVGACLSKAAQIQMHYPQPQCP